MGNLHRRRRILLGALASGAVGLLATAIGSSRIEERNKRKIGDIGGAIVPAKRISLASHGGVPGASPSVLRNAFRRAFAALTENGGGILLVAPGLYDFGRYEESTSIISANGLRNVAISAYGASFKATTTAGVMPHMFYFFNFENVTLAGASFIDAGFNPRVNWKGMYCAGIQADKESSGFRMVDCYAESVVGLFYSHNNADSRRYLRDISIQGEVRNAYYGVGASYIAEEVKVDLACHNVRRAFIAYALKNADIKVTATSTESWPGSNGFVALVCDGSSKGNVENVRIRVDASGAGIYGSYVHFYHQGTEPDGHMRHIDATVNVRNVSPAPTLFVFDHETDDVQPTTSRVWNQISLHGSVTGRLAGSLISNPSVSTSPGIVYVDRNLVSQEQALRLPRTFVVRGNPK
jgi:hypothetical protein